MNILLSGADGFVGSNVLSKLKGHEVIAVDCLKNLKPGNISSDKTFINLDLSKDIPPIDAKLDLIIHLATVNQLAICADPNLVKVNLLMIHNILDLALAHKSKVIFSSSCSVYGSGLNLTENHLLNPCSLYAIGKCYEERLIQHYHKTYGLDTVTLRFSNCYGDTTNIDNKVYPGKKDVVRIFMEKALKGEPLPLISGFGRDYTYIDDVTNAILSVIRLKGSHVFNVGTGVETLTDDLARMVLEALNVSAFIDYKPPRETDNVDHRSLNVGKIAPYWKPKISLKEGLKKYALRCTHKS